MDKRYARLSPPFINTYPNGEGTTVNTELTTESQPSRDSGKSPVVAGHRQSQARSKATWEACRPVGYSTCQSHTNPGESPEKKDFAAF